MNFQISFQIISKLFADNFFYTEAKRSFEITASPEYANDVVNIFFYFDKNMPNTIFQIIAAVTHYYFQQS